MYKRLGGQQLATGIQAFCTVFLFREDRVLLLKRSDKSRFAPGRWTGVGGRVEASEWNDLQAVGLREVAEETGILPGEVNNLRIRVVWTQPEGADVVVIAFLTGQTDREALGPCDEGELCWIEVEKTAELDWIGNARVAFDCAYQAMQDGEQSVSFGVGEQDVNLQVRQVAFLDTPSVFSEEST